MVGGVRRGFFTPPQFFRQSLGRKDKGGKIHAKPRSGLKFFQFELNMALKMVCICAFISYARPPALEATGRSRARGAASVKQ
jgi:hypothetical protein